eukprot:717494-Rhodomonas_salina.1
MLAGWGSNAYGQLGLGDTLGRGNVGGQMGDALPAAQLGYNLAVKVACGQQHSCALLDSGDVKCELPSCRGPGQVQCPEPTQ